MKNSKTRIIFILTIIIGLIFAFFVRNYLTQVQDQAVKAQEEKAELSPVIVAAKEIPQGTKIEASFLKEMKIPKELVHPESITTIQDAVGQFTTVDLTKEELILKTKLASSATSNELPYQIPEGKRAITVSVTPLIGVGGHIKPDHYIDVLGIYIFGTEENTKPEVLTLLQNIKVLAVGPETQKAEGVMTAENITLAVTPEEAEYLTLTESIGRMKFTLRPVGEEQINSLPTASENSLKSKYR